MSTTSTPYDDVFRTLLNDGGNLVIPLVNEVFGKRYTGDEEIIFSANEHFLNRQDGEEEKRITDTSFKIVGKEMTWKYHLECQSSADNSMLIRLFEYDTQIALDEGKIEGDILTLTFPHSAVLFLRCRASTPDRMEIRMVTPGGELAYGIPVVKMQQYTLTELFEKRLLFLIPFHIFSHESRFEEYERDGEKLEFLEQECGWIKTRLEELAEQGEISEYVKRVIGEMSGKVLEHIAQRYKNILEGVKSVMMGRVLEYEAKTIWNEGRSIGRMEGRMEGRKEGRNEGRMEERAKNEKSSRQKAIRFILKQRGLQSPESMADSAEVDIALVNRVCHIAEKDPDVKPEAVYDMLNSQE